MNCLVIEYIGHLKLWDEGGLQLLCFLSELQLLIGMHTAVFSLPFTVYGQWGGRLLVGVNLEVPHSNRVYSGGRGCMAPSPTPSVWWGHYGSGSSPKFRCPSASGNQFLSDVSSGYNSFRHYWCQGYSPASDFFTRSSRYLQEELTSLARMATPHFMD